MDNEVVALPSGHLFSEVSHQKIKRLSRNKRNSKNKEKTSMFGWTLKRASRAKAKPSKTYLKKIKDDDSESVMSIFRPSSQYLKEAVEVVEQEDKTSTGTMRPKLGRTATSAKPAEPVASDKQANEDANVSLDSFYKKKTEEQEKEASEGPNVNEAAEETETVKEVEVKAEAEAEKAVEKLSETEEKAEHSEEITAKLLPNGTDAKPDNGYLKKLQELKDMDGDGASEAPSIFRPSTEYLAGAMDKQAGIGQGSEHKSSFSAIDDDL